MPELNLTRISPSMIGEYESCPRLFYYRTWLGLKFPQAMRHLNFGTAIHAALDNIYDQCDDKTLWKDAEFKCVKDTFMSRWRPDMITEDDFPTKEERLECYKTMTEDGLKMLKSYWTAKEELYTKGINIIQAEIPLKIPIQNLETQELLEIPLSCRIDALTESKVVEFKTSSNWYDENETAAKPQALAYAYGYHQLKGKMPESVDYIILKKGQKGDDRLQHISIKLTEADLIGFYHRVETLLDKIKNREFSKPANHPRFCECDKYYKALDVN